MNFHVIGVHYSSKKYFYMLLQSLSLFITGFFLQAVSLRQFVATGFFSASVCGQWLHKFVANFILLAIQKRPFFFMSFFIVPINGKFSKSFKITSNAKIMQDN